MYTPVSPFERIKAFFRSPSALPRLILINITVWVAITFVGVIAFLFTQPGYDPHALFNALIIKWLAVPANIEVLTSKPFTLLTYMFLHVDFLHLLFNMLWLFWFGKIFLEYLNKRQLVFTYITGGLAGAMLYILFYNVFPVFQQILNESVALGASASVLAIVVAIAFYVPNYTMYLLFLGPVKIKYIAIISVVVDFLMIKSGNAGGHIAHLGGALWGFLFIRILKNGGYDLSAIFKNLSITRLSGFFGLRRKNKFKKVYTAGKPLTDEEYNYKRAEKQRMIDAALEKIKHSGYESLTREEKDFLFNNSKKN
ncbi:MAG: rhomboid family intramembrane serine protease [Bacteroidales bacterium]|nr:rhomboid family intramembrane serine protease [Bacteroidales bacterium]MDZ4203665.1 rhomboid family intramembrane serine protease [Bacteroidales bacterium]